MHRMHSVVQQPENFMHLGILLRQPSLIFFLGVAFVICQYFCSCRHRLIVSYKNSEILYILPCKNKDCSMWK